jgi:flagellar motility protein MotE (MotC chaperone)
MTRILQSGWFAALLGCILYLATTVFVLSPSKFAGAHFMKPDYSADDDPSWRFRNPEFNQWVSEIQDEKDKLDLQSQQLGEWQTRLDAEAQEIYAATQMVCQLQSNFDQDVIRFRAEDMDNVKHQAKLISAMSPGGAAALLGQMPDDDVVRILFVMKPDEASSILDTLSQTGMDGARRAALLTERLHQVLPAPTPVAATP